MVHARLHCPTGSICTKRGRGVGERGAACMKALLHAPFRRRAATTRCRPSGGPAVAPKAYSGFITPALAARSDAPLRSPAMSKEDEQPPSPSRRRMLQAAGAALALPASGAVAQQRAASSAAPPARAYVFFNPAEAAFIEAAVERLIPHDEIGPGALDAGVPEYIDKQLAGAWGAGERLYRSGPWSEGTPSQGYQLPHTPAELFRTAIRGVDPGFMKM